METFEAEVIDKKIVAKDYVELLLHLKKPLDFVPGQYVVLIDNIDGQVVSRAYSLASPPSLALKEHLIKLLIKKKEKGFYSVFVYDKMEKGRVIKVMGPAGNMLLSNAPTKNYYFIASGSGIAPFISMVYHLVENKNYNKIVLIHGEKRKEYLPYEEELRSLPITYLPVLSREEREGYFYGHVQDVLPNYIDKEGSYFICGMPKMVEEVESMLKGKVSYLVHESY